MPSAALATSHVEVAIFGPHTPHLEGKYYFLCFYSHGNVHSERLGDLSEATQLVMSQDVNSCLSDPNHVPLFLYQRVLFCVFVCFYI